MALSWSGRLIVILTTSPVWSYCTYFAFAAMAAPSVFFVRHGRACPGHPRFLLGTSAKTWMPGSSPGTTAMGAARPRLHQRGRLHPELLQERRGIEHAAGHRLRIA